MERVKRIDLYLERDNGITHIDFNAEEHINKYVRIKKDTLNIREIITKYHLTEIADSFLADIFQEIDKNCKDINEVFND